MQTANFFIPCRPAENNQTAVYLQNHDLINVFSECDSPKIQVSI